MASASVNTLGVCGAFDALESLGLFRANGPIAVHLVFRMHRLPPRVVFVEARILKKHGSADYHSEGLPPVRRTGCRLYSPSIGTIRLGRANGAGPEGPWDARICESTVFWKAPSSSSGSTMRKDFRSTMASRRQVFRS